MMQQQCLHRLLVACHLGRNTTTALLQHVSFSTAAASPPPGGGGQPRGQGQGKDRSRQLPALVRYGRDLSEEARRGLLDPVIGRQDVIQRTLQVLLRRSKHNPLLIGEAGVGKTAIAEGIAQLMAAPTPPKGLSGKRLVALDVASVVAGSTYRGEFEERLQSLLHDCETAQGSVVLFIDEIHVLVGAGNVEGGLDFANMLKPALARSQLQVIGATTLDEYRQHIETDPALTRRFQPILVDEPSPQECLQLLEGLAPRYEAFHGVNLPADTLATAVAAAQRYIPERRLPDSAIDLLDEAAAKIRLAAAYTPPTTPGSAHCGHSSSSSSPSSLGSSPDQQQQQQQQWVNQGESRSSPAPSGLSSFQADLSEAGLLYDTQQATAAPSINPRPATASNRSGPQEQHSSSPQQQQQQQQQQQGAAGPSGLSGSGVGKGGGGSAQTWSGWVQAKGWRGEAEVHRQQLLEWFGASPSNPLKGSAGHQQTTSERRKKHQQLFGDGARPDFTGSTAAAAAAAVPLSRPQSPSASAAAAGAAGAAAGGGGLLGGKQQAALDTTSLPSLGSTGPLDYTAKPCPHCGTVVLPAQSRDPVRLQCGHCGFRFLNVAPEKLQLGTTVLMDKQQHGPWYAGTVPATQQQQGWDEKHAAHKASLSDTPADVAAAAALGGGTATSQAAPPARRTTVAVQERLQAGSTDDNRAQQQDDATASGAQQRWEQQQQFYRDQQQQQPAAPGFGGGGLTPTGPPGPRRGAGGAAAAGSLSVSPTDILAVVAEATGIPQHLLTGLPAAAGSQQGGSSATAAALQELATIQSALLAAVQGQQAAVAAVIGALRLSRMGLARHQHTSTQLASTTAGSARPALSLLFQGPSGVGKSTAARTLAEQLLPAEPAGVLVFSCGEFSERHSISRLVGAPPGYVGYGRGGLLTEAVRRRPHSCVVLDDVDRAHPDVVGLLLQAVEDGYLMDSMGHTINLRSTVFIFTANTNRPAVVTAASSRAAAAAGAATGAAAGLSSGRSTASALTGHTAGAVRALHSLHAPGDGCAERTGWLQASGSAPGPCSSSSSSSNGSMRRSLYSLGGSGSEGAELSELEEPPAAGAGGRPAAPASSSSSSSTASGTGSGTVPPGPAGGGGGGAKDAMMDELGSRVDDVIRFQPLDDASMAAIVHQQLQQAVEQAAAQGVLLQVDPQAAAWLAAAGGSATQGARPLVQLIRRHVLVPLAAAVMDSYATGGEAGRGGQGLWAVADVGMPAAGVDGAPVPKLQLQKLQP